MTKLYTRNGSEPAPIPFRLLMPDGFTRTDPSTFSQAEIAAAGYVEAPAAPAHDPETHHAPTWDGAQWIVAPLSAEELASRAEQRRAALVDGIVAERARRLAIGFDYDFGDDRGVHHIGTTPEDMLGWDEVTQGSQAAIALGNPDKQLLIATDTGAVQVTAIEWQAILDAATAARQPIWHASFNLQAMDPIPENYADDGYWLSAETGDN